MTVSVTLNMWQMLEDWHIECRLYQVTPDGHRAMVASACQTLALWPEDHQDDPLTAILRTLRRWTEDQNQPSPIA